jgi:hypothetical protein
VKNHAQKQVHVHFIQYIICVKNSRVSIIRQQTYIGGGIFQETSYISMYGMAMAMAYVYESTGEPKKFA